MPGDSVAAPQAEAVPVGERQTAASPRGSFLEVLSVAFRLGISSFGGPIAHLGYFRNEYVLRRRWLDETTFADLIALFQFLPGPTSSELGISIGILRAGKLGGLAAWLGFTLPSAVALTLFAYGLQRFNLADAGWVHGLQLVAVAVVAQAVWGMARTLCHDRPRATIAGVAAIAVLASGSSTAQLAAIALGAVAGWRWCRAAPPASTGHIDMPVSRCAGIVALTLFFVLLVGLPIVAAQSPETWIARLEAFYRSGALVFGGGHVVLPLLREAFVPSGWVGDDAFLAVYGAAQAVPGPLFTFAAYLGAVASPPPNGVAGAVLGLVGIFLPGLLVLLGTLPFWDRFRARVDAQATMRGVNAAVVGLLGAALYNPVWTSSVKAPTDLAIALAAFVLLTAWRAPPFLVVVAGALAGVALGARA